MDIEQSINQRLSTFAPLTALVRTQITLTVATEDTPELPLLTYRTSDAEPHRQHPQAVPSRIAANR